MAWSDKHLIGVYNRLLRDRAEHEPIFNLIASLLSPWRGDFSTETTPGRNRMLKLFDSTGITALDNLTAGLYGTTTNEAQRWFSLSHPDPGLMNIERVKQYVQLVESWAVQSYGPAVSNFYAAVPPLFRDAAGFGTGVFFEEEIPGRGVFSRCRPIREIVFEEDSYDEVETLIRCFRPTYSQMVGYYMPRAGKVPEKLAELARKYPERRSRVYHGTYMNPDWKPGKLGPAGMPVLSHHVWAESETRLYMGGFWRFPWYVLRWSRENDTPWGIGQGHRALSDVRMLQAMKKTQLEAGQRAANPSLLAVDKDSLQTLRTTPGGVTVGGLDKRGNPLVKPLYTGHRADIPLELMQDTREQIKDAFYFSLLQLVGRSGMTATEVLDRQEERMRLMAPHATLINQHFAAKSVARRVDMGVRNGQLPPPPPELQQQPLVVTFQSALHQAMKSAQASSSARLVEDILRATELDPAAADLFNGDAFVRHMREGRGAPPDLILGDDVVAQRRKARAEREQQQAALDVGQQGANIVQQMQKAVA